jgi:hypothetical protein
VTTSTRDIMAIDPGYEQSAWLIYDGVRPQAFGLEDNEKVLWILRRRPAVATVLIEKIESYGMIVGREVFDTVWWAGRFAEAVEPTPVIQVPRRSVKLAVCGDTRAKDANIRQALIDMFGGPAAIRKGGVLWGISKDVWSALAIAVTGAGRPDDRDSDAGIQPVDPRLEDAAARPATAGREHSAA